jgi:hypothetical protein
VLDNPWIDHYVALDEIGNPEETGQISYDRWKKMRARGLVDAIPVYHFDEDVRYLKTYIDEGADYIGLGSVEGTTATNVRALRFFKDSFEIFEQAGRPIKVHAFGVGIPQLLRQFPFASADCSSWILHPMEFQSTDLSRLGDRQWQLSLTSDARIAAGLFLECRDAHRLEQEIRERPGRENFCFYLVTRLSNAWAMAALRLIGHRHALFSYAALGLASSERLQQFVENLDALLAQEPYAKCLALLTEMAKRYEERHNCNVVRIGFRRLA